VDKLEAHGLAADLAGGKLFAAHKAVLVGRTVTSVEDAVDAAARHHCAGRKPLDARSGCHRLPIKETAEARWFRTSNHQVRKVIILRNVGRGARQLVANRAPALRAVLEDVVLQQQHEISRFIVVTPLIDPGDRSASGMKGELNAMG
jgi:hypothetical protein